MKKIIPISLCFLAGCSLAPDFVLPQIGLPSAWQNMPEASPVEPLNEKWWEGFGSKELPGLVAKARAANPDLEAALARVEAADAAERIATAPLFPSLTGEASAGRDFNNRATALQSRAVSHYRSGLTVAYSADLFAKNRDAARSAAASSDASIYDQQALELTVTAQAAQSYFNLAALSERVKLAQTNLANARAVLNVTRIRKEAGALSALELAQQEAFVGTSEATLATLERQQEAEHNALAVLLGTTPESFSVAPVELSELQLPGVPAALPAEWLAQRPDIARAEAQLKAANFDIGAARAAFLPSIDLSASTALAASPASSAASTLSSLAGSVTMPFFSGGALEGALKKATARQKELVADYRKTVLAAVADTENALKAVATETTRAEALERAAAAAQTGYDAAQARFRAGAIDSITLLDAERSLLQAQDSLAQARADRLSAGVNLFRAMGGGWTAHATASTATTSGT